MKAITFQGIETLTFEEVPDPELADPGDALVRVRAAGLCGSDLHPYFGRERGLDPGTVMGHEFVARVEQAEDASLVGRRVVGEINVACGTCATCRAER